MIRYAPVPVTTGRLVTRARRVQDFWTRVRSGSTRRALLVIQSDSVPVGLGTQLNDTGAYL
jgi:hypothetical protein